MWVCSKPFIALLQLIQSYIVFPSNFHFLYWVYIKTILPLFFFLHSLKHISNVLYLFKTDFCCIHLFLFILILSFQQNSYSPWLKGESQHCLCGSLYHSCLRVDFLYLVLIFPIIYILLFSFFLWVWASVLNFRQPLQFYNP